ncbi:hypothetical protein A4U61_08560 [Streptomyces sp. H-KF8]|nr:hypothetical protein A4U61_08560 [Streptomyces sp. H-KF8]
MCTVAGLGVGARGDDPRAVRFHRLARCHERRTTVIDAFFGLAGTVITVRGLIRRARTTPRGDSRPHRRQ